MNDFGTEKFKQFAKENRLRLKQGEDRFPIVASSSKYRGAHLYDGFGDDAVGLWVSRDTKKKFTFMKNRLIKLGAVPHVLGDMEGTFKVAYEDVMRVANHLKMVKFKRGFKKK